MTKTDKWAFVNRDDKRILKFACPSCGQWGDLEDHTTWESGIITPSVDCPECDFHDLVVLAGFPNNPYQGRTF